MNGFNIVTWFILIGAILAWVKTVNALTTGNISLKWEIVERTKDPGMFWFMLVGTLIAATFATVLVVHEIVFSKR
jgi:hypothetical protein